MKKDDYYIMPFYKKMYYNIVDSFTSKIKNFQFKWKKSIIIVLLLSIFLGTILIIMNQKNVFPSRVPYNKEGFDYANNLNKNTKYEMQNDEFKFMMEFDTSFALTDKRTQQVYSSNLPDSQISETKELFNITYMRTIENQVVYKVSENSIKSGEYGFRIIKDKKGMIESIEVLYKIGGKKGVLIDGIKYDVEDIPKNISKERFDSIYENVDKSEAEASYKKKLLRRLTDGYTWSKEKNCYVLVGIISSDDMKTQFAQIFYIYGGYTNDDLLDDNNFYGNVSIVDIPYFEFSVIYKLNKNGLSVELINDSIVENSSFPILNIEVLPFFGAGTKDDNGYLMIPDGSGALINFDNNKYKNTYTKRLYGADYGLMHNVNYKIEEVEQIHLPMYGILSNGYSFITIIENGAEMAELNAGFKSRFDENNNVTQKIAYSNYKYYLREIDNYKIDIYQGKATINIWADEYNKENFKLKYSFINKENSTYNDMATEYRDYLTSEGVLKDKTDTTSEGIFNLTLLGSYLEKNFFIGIPYDKSKSLTTTKEAKEIVDKLLAENIQNINVIYNGFANNGLKPYTMKDIDFEKSTGSKKDFLNLNQYLSEKNIDLYLDTYALTGYTDKNIHKKNDVIRNLLKKTVTRYPFHPGTFLADTEKTPYYSLKTTALEDFLKGIQKDLYKSGFENLSYIDLGNEINSSFKKGEVIYRTDAKKDIVNLLSNQNNKFNNIFRSPNDYVLPYSKFLLDLPSSGTNMPVIDELIPFMQLVYNGVIDYSGEQINLDDKYSLTWHKLRAIETGSNISFTWSYQNTINLVETEYNYYYSTYYKNYFEDAVNIYNELNGLNIYNSKIVKHESIHKGEIVRVTYDNGSVFEINYNNLTYTKSIAGGL